MTIAIETRNDTITYTTASREIELTAGSINVSLFVRNITNS